MINALLLLLPMAIVGMAVFLCLVFWQGETRRIRALFVYFLVAELIQYAWLSTTELTLTFFPHLAWLEARAVRALVARSLQVLGMAYLLFVFWRDGRA